jgi:hypothetical protein
LLGLLCVCADGGERFGSWDDATSRGHQGFIDAFTRECCRDIFDPLNAITYSQGEA